MTKLRPPDSIEDAIVQAVALLGGGSLSIVLDVSESMINKWSNHDDPAHRIGLHQALKIENLLIKAGHEPVFGALFERLNPLPPSTAVEQTDPLREAMRATVHTTQLMAGVDAALIDGCIDRTELGRIETLTYQAQKQIARVRRVVRVAANKLSEAQHRRRR